MTQETQPHTDRKSPAFLDHTDKNLWVAIVVIMYGLLRNSVVSKLSEKLSTHLKAWVDRKALDIATLSVASLVYLRRFNQSQRQRDEASTNELAEQDLVESPSERVPSTQRPRSRSCPARLGYKPSANGW